MRRGCRKEAEAEEVDAVLKVSEEEEHTDEKVIIIPDFQRSTNNC